MDFNKALSEMVDGKIVVCPVGSSFKVQICDCVVDGVLLSRKCRFMELLGENWLVSRLSLEQIVGEWSFPK